MKIKKIKGKENLNIMTFFSIESTKGSRDVVQSIEHGVHPRTPGLAVRVRGLYKYHTPQPFWVSSPNTSQNVYSY